VEERDTVEKGRIASEMKLAGKDRFSRGVFKEGGVGKKCPFWVTSRLLTKGRLEH